LTIPFKSSGQEDYLEGDYDLSDDKQLALTQFST